MRISACAAAAMSWARAKPDSQDSSWQIPWSTNPCCTWRIATRRCCCHAIPDSLRNAGARCACCCGCSSEKRRCRPWRRDSPSRTANSALRPESDLGRDRGAERIQGLRHISFVMGDRHVAFRVAFQHALLPQHAIEPAQRVEILAQAGAIVGDLALREDDVEQYRQADHL